MARQTKRQLKVTVLQRGGHKGLNDIVEEMTRRIVARMFSTRMANTLRLRIELRATTIDSDAVGTAHFQKVYDAARKTYTIKLQRDRSVPRIIRTLAHELKHIEQYATGRLRHGRKSGAKGWFYKPTREGRGEFFEYGQLPWAERPWEKEAIAASDIGTEVFREWMNEDRATHKDQVWQVNLELDGRNMQKVLRKKFGASW